MSHPNPESEILALKQKIRHLEAENLDLTAQLEKTNRVIEAFKKIGKPPSNKVKLGFPINTSENMI